MSKYVGFLVAAGAACFPMMSSAAAPTLGEVLGASGVTLDAYISGSYQTSFNDGQHNLLGRAFDGTTDSFTLNQAAFTLSKLPAEGAGGLVNVMAGEDAKVINTAYGDDVDPTTGISGNKINVTQAYLQYATGPFSIAAGRFITLAGAEVINDTQNANISRSFLFTMAIPFVHTGVRGTVKSGAFTGYLGAMNSALSGAATDGDKTKTVELGVSFAPSSTLTASLVDYYGVDDHLVAAGTPIGRAESNILDGVLSFQATNALQLVLNADYTYVDPSTAGIPTARIYGVAGYANYKFTDRARGSLRAEYLKLKNDIAAGLLAGDGDNSLTEVTATVGYMVAQNLEVLGEVRYDVSGDDNVFLDPTANTDNQGDVAVKAIYKF